MSVGEAVAALCDAVGLIEPPGWRAYQELAAAWSRRTDLTSARGSTELAEVLFLDAAHAIARRWVPAGARLVDVGAGIGAPTIPILLSDATLWGTLVEPRRIRTTFLRTAIGTLGLAGRAHVVEGKVDPKRPQVDGSPFRIALSRATFAPAQWLPIGASLAEEVWAFTAGTTPQAPAPLEHTRSIHYQVPSTRSPRALSAFQGTRTPTKT